MNVNSLNTQGIKYYQNKRNSNKYIELHCDGHYHYSARQFLLWSNGVKNFTGDGKLHRWKRRDLIELLEDYEQINEIDVGKERKRKVRTYKTTEFIKILKRNGYIFRDKAKGSHMRFINRNREQIIIPVGRTDLNPALTEGLIKRHRLSVR